MSTTSSAADGRHDESLDPEYFARIYAEGTDPWGFATSDYERRKYADTLSSLPAAQYHAALELGCAIGVLSRQLAPRVDRLLAIDLNADVLREARARNADHAHLRFVRMRLPREWPLGERFDLVVVSEVAYYWADGDFRLAQRRIYDSLEPGGHLVLVHYTPTDTDYPLTGDEVHERFLADAEGPTAVLRHAHGHRADRYRLDVFERTATAPAALSK